MHSRITKLISPALLLAVFTLMLFAGECAAAGDYPSPSIVVLGDGGSFDFSTVSFGSYSGGDFYLSGLKFLANNTGQRGLVDVGDTGTIPLYFVNIPESGYTRLGVDVVKGHTYVCLAMEGEEGNFAVFRVRGISGGQVEFEYVYLYGRSVEMQEGEDFYSSIGILPSGKNGNFTLNSLKFSAASSSAGGLKDLGNTGDLSLYRTAIPAEGYAMSGVPAVLGHTYVSLAPAGEGGNSIVFRVTDISGSAVTVKYVFVGPTELALSNGYSYDFSGEAVNYLSGGDLYLYDLSFLANNSGQRGLKDLGNTGDGRLLQTGVPAAGYTRTGQQVISGHTYISEAQTGEQGNFLAFRVKGIDGQSVTIDYAYLPPAEVTLANGSSFDFSGAAAGPITEGELYLSGLTFWANNSGQNGVQDLGDLGDVSLDAVSIPESGYSRQGVPAVLGHTYAVLPKEGEEGNYIVFRITAVSGQAVTIRYLYMTPNRVTLSSGESYDFSDYAFGSLTGGDFYVGGDLQFWANNSGQQGVQDLGDLGTLPLGQVEVPAGGYTQQGVPAEAGHTYVSMAQEGETGKYIVFRVHSVGSESVTIDYIYKTVTGISSGDDEGMAVTTYVLEQNYPNPFNSTTEIEYRIGKTGYVDLSLYNPLGQKVRTLVARKQSPGRYRAYWDGRDEQGRAVTSGIYYYRIRSAGFADIRKLVLIK
ncbi:MAG: FlgD immunoglobulin-like domain containing protein [Calditrichia bacterium]